MTRGLPPSFLRANRWGHTTKNSAAPLHMKMIHCRPEGVEGLNAKHCYKLHQET